MVENKDNLISCSNVTGMPVFSINEGQNVGFVKNVLMELEDKKSLVFLIEDNEWYKGAKVLEADDVMKIGQEALVIENSHKLTSFSELPEGNQSVTRNDSCRGKMVVDSDNNKLGKVKGCLIDRNTIKVSGVVFETKDEEEREIPSEQIIAVKTDVVVIGESNENPVKIKNGNGHAKEEDKKGPLDEQEHLEAGTLVEQNVALDNVTKLERPAVEDEHVQKTGPVAQKSLKEILEERQDKFLLGKRVDRDILTDDGSALIKKDEVITEQVLKEAKDSHKYIVLSFCIKRN